MKSLPPRSNASVRVSQTARRETAPATVETTAAPDGTSPPNPKWSWHYRALLQLRDRLIRAQADHSRQAASLAEEITTGDAGDTSQESGDRDLLWAELGAESNRLLDVENALQRIRSGAYGLCEESGLPIPMERLRAIPWTRYSVAAAQRLEERAADSRKSRV